MDLSFCLWLRSSCATEEQVSASFTSSRSWRKRLFSGYFLSSASSSITFSSIRSNQIKGKDRDNNRSWIRLKAKGKIKKSQIFHRH